MWKIVEITMIFWIVLLAFENLLFLQGRLYQEQYHRMEDCKNNVPSSTSIVSIQNVENIFRCLKLCQINPLPFQVAQQSQSAMHVGKPNKNNIKHGEVSLEDWYFGGRVLSSRDVGTVYSMYFMQ